ncbi:MAG: carbohydrate ABC transporter substrate-binding protein, partial [Candidatus Devosia euplotis]|nr:carbohydrate ABC transporter substrate-binding protein [Candidatus Devosia euplotis]
MSKADYLNEDFGAAKYSDGIRMVANGEDAHYPMLTVAVGAIAEGNPEHLADVGFFAQPGDGPNGLTTWMPDGVYIPRTTSNEEASRKFVAFIVSPKACAIRSATVGATGPYLISGCDL